jgi:hypothetical protein
MNEDPNRKAAYKKAYELIVTKINDTLFNPAATVYDDLTLKYLQTAQVYVIQNKLRDIKSNTPDKDIDLLAQEITDHPVF